MKVENMHNYKKENVFFGHVMRTLENFVMTGKTSGEKRQSS